MVNRGTGWAGCTTKLFAAGRTYGTYRERNTLDPLHPISVGPYPLGKVGYGTDAIGLRHKPHARHRERPSSPPAVLVSAATGAAVAATSYAAVALPAALMKLAAIGVSCSVGSDGVCRGGE